VEKVENLICPKSALQIGKEEEKHGRFSKMKQNFCSFVICRKRFVDRDQSKKPSG
jgi:hypothetical protein